MYFRILCIVFKQPDGLSQTILTTANPAIYDRGEFWFERFFLQELSSWFSTLYLLYVEYRFDGIHVKGKAGNFRIFSGVIARRHPGREEPRSRPNGVVFARP